MGLAELISGGGSAADAPELGVSEGEAAPATPPKTEELGVEGDDTGKPKAIPYARFAEVNVRRKTAEERLAKLEAEHKALSEKHGSFSKDFESLYSKFENPTSQLKEDAAFAQAAYELREDPTVKQALAIISKHYHGAQKAMQRDEKPAATEPQSDPRVDDLVREGIRDKARGILGEAKVRDQLHGPILDYVLAQNVKPTREAILTAMREYVGAQGWTNEFLRGSGQKPKPAMVPNPGGLNAGAPKKDAPQAPAKPKTLSEIQERNRQAFKEKLAQRLS